MIVPGISCACGSTDIIAIKPGTEPDRFGQNDLFFAISLGEPSVAWCWSCWPVRPQQRDLSAQVPA
jgi:hypothetical protein